MNGGRLGIEELETTWNAAAITYFNVALGISLGMTDE
jgi:hypothetical protein